MHFSELFVVLIVVLLVFPPKKLPELAQTLGRLLRTFQSFKNQLFSEIQPIEKHLQLKENQARAEKAEKE